MSDDYELGRDGVLYYCATLLGGSNAVASATWVEIGNIKDLSMPMTADKIDVSTRINKKWKAFAPGLKDASIDFDMLWKKNDAGFQALKDAFLDGAQIALMALSGPKAQSGSEGLVANFIVNKCEKKEPLADAQVASISVSPSSEIDWYEVP